MRQIDTTGTDYRDIERHNYTVMRQIVTGGSC